MMNKLNVITGILHFIYFELLKVRVSIKSGVFSAIWKIHSVHSKDCQKKNSIVFT